jgi:hypothetical protein
MDLNVFTCRNGFLLSAQCMLVPQRATELYWPVSSVLGIVDCRQLPSALCDRILDAIDAKHFAFVSSAEALRVGLPTLASMRPYAETGVHPHPR